MRSKLLKSFLYVFGFWWVGFALWWSVSDPEINLRALARIHHLLPFLPVHMPEGAVSVLDALNIQRQVFTYWVIPLLIITTVLGAAGSGVIWALTWNKHKERNEREAPSGSFRGATVTMGPLAVPSTMHREIVELGAADSEAFAVMTEQDKALLFDIIGVIAANPNAYAGDGHGVNLLEHTLRVVEEALASKNRPSLSAIVAAGHELGKITAYKKDAAGEWKPVKNQDREASRAMAMLDSWWALPADARTAVLFAVKYKSQPALLPDIPAEPHIHKLAKDLLYRAAESTEKVSSVAKARVLEKHELPAVALKAFLDALPTLPFQDGLPKGVKAVGWKVGTRLYLIEIKLRETVMAKLDPDIRGALDGAYKDRKKLAAFTQEFLKALDSKGWLVKDVNGVKLDAKEALWTILAGKYEYKGVIIIDIPQEYKEMLPSKDSLYEIKVQGPLFQPAPQAASSSMTSADLTDLGLFKKPDAAKAQPAAKPTE